MKPRRTISIRLVIAAISCVAIGLAAYLQVTEMNREFQVSVRLFLPIDEYEQFDRSPESLRRRWGYTGNQRGFGKSVSNPDISVTHHLEPFSFGPAYRIKCSRFEINECIGQIEDQVNATIERNQDVKFLCYWPRIDEIVKGGIVEIPSHARTDKLSIEGLAKVNSPQELQEVLGSQH